jgi:hypothetical protein
MRRISRGKNISSWLLIFSVFIWISVVIYTRNNYFALLWNNHKTSNNPEESHFEIIQNNIHETIEKLTSENKAVSETAVNIIYDLHKEIIKAMMKLKPGVERDDPRLFARRNILLVGDFRSGSSFTGNMLNAYPASYYSFEPLQYSWNYYPGNNMWVYYLLYSTSV